MRKSHQNLKSVRACIQALMDMGALEPGQIGINKAVKELDHALQVRDLRRIEAAVNELAKLFVQLA